MAALVEAFNQINRPKKTPSGAANHWHFIVRHVPFNPPGDLVQIVHPESHFIHCSPPAEILSLDTPAAQASVVVPLLLQSFVRGVDAGPNGEPLPDIPSFAPWSWSTHDPALSAAVTAELTVLKVRQELRNVSISNPNQDAVADESWAGFIEKVMEVTGAKIGQATGQKRKSCNSCKQDSSWFSDGLKACAKCRDAVYCSRDCQKSDWKTHKKSCNKDAVGSNDQDPSSGVSKGLDPHAYMNTVAHTVPEARDLLKSLNLPVGPGVTQGTRYPMRRLVLAGKDTPKNIELIYGPSWAAEQSLWDETRIEVLLKPPPGSPSYAMSSSVDIGAPAQTPRPASAEETIQIQEVRDMQAAISRHMHGRKDPSSKDMQAILTSFGPDWPTMLPIYQLAVNTMDQGVNIG